MMAENRSDNTTTTRDHTLDGLVERTEHHAGPETGYIEWRLNSEEISVDTAADLLARTFGQCHIPPNQGDNPDA